MSTYGCIDYERLAKKLKEALEKLESALASIGADKLRVSVVDELPESPFNLVKIAGVKLTGRDWSADLAKLQNLDTTLSSRASESTLSAILSQLDIKLSELRDSLKPVRATPTQDLAGYTIGKGGVVEITKSNLNGYSAIVVTVRATYDPNATAGVRVRWLYSPDGTNFDSPEDAEAQGNYEDLTYDKGQTRQCTILVPILAPYVKIQIVNRDQSYPVTVDVWTLLLR